MYRRNIEKRIIKPYNRCTYDPRIITGKKLITLDVKTAKTLLLLCFVCVCGWNLSGRFFHVKMDGGSSDMVVFSHFQLKQTKTTQLFFLG